MKKFNIFRRKNDDEWGHAAYIEAQDADEALEIFLNAPYTEEFLQAFDTKRTDSLSRPGRAQLQYYESCDELTMLDLLALEVEVD